MIKLALTTSVAACLLLISNHLKATSYSGPIFDAHLHYAAEAAEVLDPQAVLAMFKRNQIDYALISSTPNQGTQALYAASPTKIIPFLSLYASLWDGKRNWMWDETTLPRLNANLTQGHIYRGIGEFHIFEKDLKSNIFEELILLAKAKQLPLQVHGDWQVIDRIFELYPKVKLIWAHMGTQPSPSLLRQLLNRHPQGLYIDTTVRDKQLLGDERQLDVAWKQLFVDYPDRFMVGVDTFSLNRWQHFDQVVADIRDWLGDLPPQVAYKIAYQNAYQFFLD